MLNLGLFLVSLYCDFFFFLRVYVHLVGSVCIGVWSGLHTSMNEQMPEDIRCRSLCLSTLFCDWVFDELGGT